jgi:hypothetical protein
LDWKKTENYGHENEASKKMGHNALIVG